MRRCSQCGAALREASRFCPGCGCPVDFARMVKESARKESAGQMNPLALSSVILATLFFIPFVFIPSAILSAVALARISQSGGELGGKSLAKAAMLISCCVAVVQGMMLFGATQLGLVKIDVPKHYLVPHGVTPDTVMDDLRVVAMAIERFRSFNFAYPMPLAETHDLPATMRDYLPVYHGDPYRVDGTHSFRYYSDGKSYWILTSQGPDLEQDIFVENYRGDPDSYPGSSLTYDPTNGTESRGDLWVTGPFNDTDWLDYP